jgi:phosphomannomutase
MIKFGTDGWRGLIAKDYTFENVRKVAYATAQYLQKAVTDKNLSVVVGYDARFLSDEFAQETALVFASQGIKAFLTDNISSTPQVSYMTKVKEADLGIIITASHNPSNYNGYKIKGSYGGPATPSQIELVEQELRKIENDNTEIKTRSIEYYIKNNLIQFFDSKSPYLQRLKKIVNIDLIKESKYRVLYDPMHGSGINTIKSLIPDADEIHGEWNPGFGDIDHPEPIADCLPELMKKVKSGNYDIGIATDGDADRLGLVDEEGNFVDSHKIYMIILKYLWEDRKERGEVVKTVSLSSMVNAYCEKNDIVLNETPVGFKYTAELMNTKDVLIGGEESGGIGTKLHIPERDGLFMALLVLEVMAYKKKSLKQLCDMLDDEFGPHRYARRDVNVSFEQKDLILQAAAQKPNKLGKYDVIKIDETDGYKFFVDGGWLLIRPSGTEPLIRFYSEADSLNKVNELLDEGRNLA